MYLKPMGLNEVIFEVIVIERGPSTVLWSETEKRWLGLTHCWLRAVSGDKESLTGEEN